MAKESINTIKAVLAAKGRTAKWLAAKLEVDAATVSRWCANETQPSLQTLLEIAEVLDVSVKELLFASPRTR